MAIDLEAIRKRVAELNGKNTSSVQLWKPQLGEYKVRLLPWKEVKPGVPFSELFFYYLGNGPGILTPHQFGKPDPINDLIRKLYSTGKQEDRELAKKLQPKMRCYAPVVVRGEEDKGVQVWAFGKIVYQRLLSFFLDEEVGDILSPTEGFDLKVNITKLPGKQFNDTTIDPARRPSKLHEDAEVSKKWLDAVPNINDMYKLKSKEEIETLLNNWLNGGTTDPALGDDGSSRGNTQIPDELDKIVEEVKSTTAPEEKKVAAPKKSTSDKKKTLDEAFKDLTDED